MSQAMMKEVVDQALLPPLFKGAIVCVEGLADLFFGQWGVDLKVECGFWPITIELSAQLLDAFLFAPRQNNWWLSQKLGL